MFFDRRENYLPFNDVGEDDLTVPTRSSDLGAITGPGQVKDAASIRLLQGVRPLQYHKTTSQYQYEYSKNLQKPEKVNKRI